MRISVEAAEGHLPRLVEAAARGEDVVLSQDDVPVARLVPISAPRFQIGILPQHALGPGPDFLEPMAADDLTLWEGGR